jgi:uncharacterized protein
MAKQTSISVSKENIAKIAEELGATSRQISAVIALLGDGNTIPFIARYRKEATQGLDEIALRAVEDFVDKIRQLQKRKATILKSIEEQGLLTEVLQSKIESCDDLSELEAIYLPFKPKRKTRASAARDRGLQPLADLLLKQERIGAPRESILKPYVNKQNDVPTSKDALAGALDIVAEVWSENAETRTWLLGQAKKFGRVNCKLKRGKKDQAAKFEAWIDHNEAVSKIPSHRFLAIMRGASEGVFNVSIELDESREVAELRRRMVHNRKFEFYKDLCDCVEDCFSRLLMSATESTILQSLKEQSDDQAIEVFARNLQELLMSAPAGPRVTIGIDPGFRTGCKVAIVDATGRFLANTTIYPTAPKNDIAGAGKTILALIKKYSAELVAIGNGTASRETDSFVAKLIKDNKLKIDKVIVSESGASIYSASEIAIEEFPDLDITVRGAISIARRLQDPLAELVKSDPKTIGVGQYQHDVNQPKLKKQLDRIVESCVNRVGVDLNMASAPLLSHVAGIGPAIAKNIVKFRDENGPFANRKQLKKVPKLGKRAFEQSAGFLRIREGSQPLDNSAVHPESYALVDRMAKSLKTKASQLVGNIAVSKQLSAEAFVDDQFGLPTVIDIIDELGRPGRDPRKEFKIVRFNENVTSMDDLKPNMVLEGVITNVTHFGAFIDIGVHQDALIHISQLSDTFVSDPAEVVAPGDIVKVKILEVDMARKRIAATRKF